MIASIITRTGGIRFLLVLAGSGSSLPREGRSNIRDAFFASYRRRSARDDTVPSHPTHCGVCHYDFAGGGTAIHTRASRRGAAEFREQPERRRQAVHPSRTKIRMPRLQHAAEVTNTTAYSNTPTFPG
jgi:hypothetical protein